MHHTIHNTEADRGLRVNLHIELCVPVGSTDDRECGADSAHGDPERGAAAHPRLPAPEVCDLSPQVM